MAEPSCSMPLWHMIFKYSNDYYVEISLHFSNGGYYVEMSIQTRRKLFAKPRCTLPPFSTILKLWRSCPVTTQTSKPEISTEKAHRILPKYLTRRIMRHDANVSRSQTRFPSSSENSAKQAGLCFANVTNSPLFTR
jgi:hypothetical protein